MHILKYGLIREARKDPEWGKFISPDAELENLPDPNTKLNVYIPSGIKADLSPFLNQNTLFDNIVNKIVQQRDTMSYEEQCSGKYYFDCFTLLQSLNGKVKRIVEVGTYLGGASCIFAGCANSFNIEIDLIDAKKEFLLYTYERIRRAFPESVAKIRLFYGDLISYVKNVALHEQQTDILFHHDAGHNFNHVVNDISSLYYIKDKAHSLIIQDTHLRSAKVQNYIFVDAAIFAVFGFNAKFAEIGVKFAAASQPAYAGKTYFIDNHSEGFYIPFELNQFHYPHPSMGLENIDTTV